MKTRHLRRYACIGTLIAVGSLAGCSSSDGAADAAESTRSEAPSSPAQESASPTASAAPAFATPAECDGLQLKGGETLAGPALSKCLVAALKAYGSGTESVLSGEESGTSKFVFGDEPALAGSMTGPEGEKAYVFKGDSEWIKTPGLGKWVKGDAGSTDPQEQLVAATGKLYRVLADPAVTAQMIATAPEWTVEAERPVISLENGEDVKAWRIVNKKPYTYLGAAVREHILWFGDDFTPYGGQAESQTGGVMATTTQHFYDLGEPVTIEPPQE
ncbi:MULTISPECIES: hypothetical protein [unclassified Streptomyces]|uniref:hypothetical protein n=1 Tax=unclassified Streptomyces TaxID=2593676 RepID=UPI001660B795|nr:MULTISPECIES: hypothetical protein [unclassified Streptomyces]MBD0707302.1 hypothetical protein [Streptomyces sp. CBMA291]MBD0713790.1 hypothetical protein [Streptomyces sp. CBMA370]